MKINNKKIEKEQKINSKKIESLKKKLNLTTPKPQEAQPSPKKVVLKNAKT